MSEADELPEGWAKVQVPDLLAEPMANGRSVPDGDGFPVLRLTALRNGRVDLRERKLGAWSRKEGERFAVRRGDFLVARGNGSLSLVGRGAMVMEEPDPVAYPDTVIRLRPSKDIFVPGYLRAVWDAAETRRQIEAAAHTTAGIHKVSQKDLAAIELPVPPLPEQHRIVEKVEALLVQVNKAKDRLDRIKVILKRFRQAVLAAACSGRLTEEWRESNSVTDVDAVLKDIGWQREQASKTGRKRREVVTDADGLFETPDTWRWTTLAALAAIVGGLTKGQQRRPGDRLRDVPYLRVANVQRGYLDLSEMKEIRATESEIQDLQLMAGDILFTEGGDRDKLGRGWVWANEVPECIHQNHIFRARLYGPQVQPRLVSWFGNTFGRDYFDDAASQTVNLASINITKLSGLPVPVAPPEEQIEIVHRVDALFRVADAIEARVTAAAARAEKLPQSILSKAFKGELVPTEAELARAEGREYEPASVLLERIRVDREANGAAKKRSRQWRDASAEHK